jgi:hypothetical protein
MKKFSHPSILLSAIFELCARKLINPSNTQPTANIPSLVWIVQSQNTTCSQVINYQYLVTYAGKASLGGPVTVIDDKTSVSHTFAGSRYLFSDGRL